MISFRKITVIIVSMIFYIPLLSYSAERPRDKINASFVAIQIDKVERQQIDNSCGIASLAYILNEFFGKNTSEKNLFFFIGLKPEYSLGDIASTSSIFGIKTIGLKLKIDDLKKIKSPTILKTSTNGGHFVVYSGYRNGWFQIVDPAKGRLNYYESELKDIFIEKEKEYGSALVFFSEKKNSFRDEKLFKNNTNRLWLEK